MEYIYSLYDPQTSKLLYSGTPEQLVERGLYKRKGEVEGAKPKKWRIERERKYPEGRAARPVKQPVKKPQPKAKPEEKERTPLQRDVHRMCLYNKAALKAGKKELQYGYWVAAGKPEKPVW